MWVTRATETTMAFVVVAKRRSWLRPGEDAADFGDQRVGWARLGDEPVAAGAGGALQLAGAVVRGQRDDGNVRGAPVGLQPARRLPAVEDRETEVHQHDV